MRAFAVFLTLGVGLMVANTLDLANASVDCAERFRAGSYGVPVDELAVRTGALTVTGFAPMYLEKHNVAVSDPVDCRYATAYDVFRLIPGQRSRLLAGCYGDFDGDGRRDYALLLKEVGGRKVAAYAFLSRPQRYLAIPLGGVSDPYGFNQDPTKWPGPFCKRRPGNGRYKALGDEIAVFGDIIQVGWYAHYWLPAEQRFQDVQIQD